MRKLVYDRLCALTTGPFLNKLAADLAALPKQPAVLPKPGMTNTQTPALPNSAVAQSKTFAPGGAYSPPPAIAPASGEIPNKTLPGATVSLPNPTQLGSAGRWSGLDKAVPNYTPPPAQVGTVSRGTSGEDLGKSYIGRMEARTAPQFIQGLAKDYSDPRAAVGAGMTAGIGGVASGGALPIVGPALGKLYTGTSNLLNRGAVGISEGFGGIGASVRAAYPTLRPAYALAGGEAGGVAREIPTAVSRLSAASEGAPSLIGGAQGAAQAAAPGTSRAAAYARNMPPPGETVAVQAPEALAQTTARAAGPAAKVPATTPAGGAPVGAKYDPQAAKEITMKNYIDLVRRGENPAAPGNFTQEEMQGYLTRYPKAPAGKPSATPSSSVPLPANRPAAIPKPPTEAGAPLQETMRASPEAAAKLRQNLTETTPSLKTPSAAGEDLAKTLPGKSSARPTVVPKPASKPTPSSATAPPAEPAISDLARAKVQSKATPKTPSTTAEAAPTQAATEAQTPAQAVQEVRPTEKLRKLVDAQGKSVNDLQAAQAEQRAALTSGDKASAKFYGNQVKQLGANLKNLPQGVQKAVYEALPNEGKMAVQDYFKRGVTQGNLSLGAKAGRAARRIGKAVGIAGAVGTVGYGALQIPAVKNIVSAAYPGAEATPDAAPVASTGGTAAPEVLKAPGTNTEVKVIGGDTEQPIALGAENKPAVEGQATQQMPKLVMTNNSPDWAKSLPGKKLTPEVIAELNNIYKEQQAGKK